MQLETPEGTLTIDDERLTLVPSDDGPTISVGLVPMPNYEYQRGLYGTGTLVIDGVVIVLRNQDVAAVKKELQRERGTKATKAAPKAS